MRNSSRFPSVSRRVQPRRAPLGRVGAPAQAAAVFSALALGAAIVPHAQAQTSLYWDVDGDTSTATGGTGTWDTTSLFWRPGSATGTPLQTYAPNVDPSTVTANFAGTAGTATIAAGTTIYANVLTFGVTGYTIASASGGLLTLSGTAPTINGNGTTTFTATLAGTAGFTLAGGNFNVFAGDLTGLTGTINVNGRATLQGYAYGGTGVAAAVLTGSQNQTWNVSTGNILTSNNQGAGATIQLGAITGAGTIRAGNNGSGANTGGTDTFQVGALNTSTTFSGTFVDFAPALTALTKVGTGTLTLTGFSTHTGGTIVNAGTLALGAGGGAGAVKGAVTVNSGATLSLTATDALGYTSGSTTATLNVNGGTVNNTVTGNEGFLTNFNLTGGTVTSTGGGNFYFGSANSSVGITSNASATTSLISAPLVAQNSALTFTVAKGTTASGVDLSATGVIGSFGTQGIVKAGLGTLSLGAFSTFSGGTTVNAGTLTLAAGGGAGTVRGVVTVNAGATLNLGVNDALGYNSGTQVTVVNVNGGTVTSTVANNEGFLTSYSLTGGTVSAGSLFRFNVNAATPPSIASLASGILSQFNANIDDFPASTTAANLGISVATGTTLGGVDLQIGGVISGATTPTGITKTGTGYLNLTGQNSFAGPVIVSGGTINVGVQAPNGGGTGALGLSNAGKAITVSSGATLSGTVNNWFGDNNNAGTLPVITVNGGTLSTTRYTTIGALALNGATVTASSLDGGTTGIYQAFAFRGDVTVGGTSASTIGSTNVTTTTGGFHLNASTTFTVAPTGSTTPDLAVNAPLINQSGDFASAVGGLTKAGAGKMALNATNTYTGATTVNAGTLLVNGSTASASAVTVNNSGSVLGGTGTVSGATTINAGSTITGADVGTVGALTLQSTVTLTGGTYVVDISGATADKLTITGALTLTNANITFNGTPTAASYVLATFASETGTFAGTAPSGYTFQFNANGTELDLTSTAVPEPATWMAGCLLVGLTGLSQRRKVRTWLTLARG